jgi:hypothetical protein
MAGEETDAIDLGAFGEGWIDQAYARGPEIRPVTLSFQAEHESAALPTLTDLAAHDSSGPGTATLSGQDISRANEIQASAGLTPPGRESCRAK